MYTVQTFHPNCLSYNLNITNKNEIVVVVEFSRQIFDFSSMTTTLYISWHIKRFHLSIFLPFSTISPQGTSWRPLDFISEMFFSFMWIGQTSEVCFAHGSIKIVNLRNILFFSFIFLFLSMIIKWKTRKFFSLLYCWIWKIDC